MLALILSALTILLIVAAVPSVWPDPPVPMRSPCVKFTQGGLYLPCSYITPSRYPLEWWQSGQNI